MRIAGRCLNDQHFVAPAENVAKAFVARITSQRASAQKPAHPRHEIPIGRLDHQVQGVAHQAEGVDFKKRQK